MFRLFVCCLKRSTLAASVAITAITATLAADGGRSVLVEDVPSQNFPRLISAVLSERKLGVANVNQATREVFSTYEEYDWNNVRCRSQWAFRYDAGAVTVTLQDREGKTASGWMKMTVLNAGAGPEEAMLRRMMERMKALNAQLAGTASPKAASGAPAPVASGAPPGRAPAVINRTSDSTYLERPPAVDSREPGVDHAIPMQLQMRYDVVCGEGLCAVYKDGSWGFIDRTGKLVIDFQYDQESLASGPPVFHGGLCAVKLKQPSPEVIYIDRKGGRQFPNLHLTRAGSFNAGLAVVEVMGRSGTAVIDVKGEILGTNPDSITNPLYYEEFVDGFSSGSKGYYDTHLRLAIPFSGLHKSFREGLAWVYYAEPGSQDTKWGAIDSTRRFVIPPTFHNSPGDFYEGLAAVQDNNSKWGFIDKSGTLKIPCQYTKASNFVHGHALVENRDTRKAMLIDHDGAVLRTFALSYFFNVMTPRRDGMYIYRVGGDKCGLLDSEGNVVLPARLRCGNIGLFMDSLDGLAVASAVGGLEGFVNRHGDFVVIISKPAF